MEKDFEGLERQQQNITTNKAQKLDEKNGVTCLFILFAPTVMVINPLSAKLTKWPNTLEKFVGNLPTNCLSVFGHFLGLALKGLKSQRQT